MVIYISHHFFHYEAGNLCRLFFPYHNLRVVEDMADFSDEDIKVKAIINTLQDKIEYFVEFCENDKSFVKTIYSDITSDNKVLEQNICKCIFLSFSEYTDYKPKWGMLTGIHPVKFFEQIALEQGYENAEKIYREEYFVSEEKISLSKIIVDTQKPAINLNKEDNFSLYISIPFCPSRCNYCSFVSQSIEKTKKLIPPYLELLLKEIEESAKISNSLSLKLLTVYIGGGTPTTLSEKELEILISQVYKCFDMTHCVEFTVEAGRPDTINDEKLKVLADKDIKRISINPQSMNDEVLKIIGRKHSAKQVVEMYKKARAVGISQINMDLIAGLKGEDFQSFKNSLDEVIDLDPQNITVHSLALKRSADIFRDENKKEYHDRVLEVTKMVEYSVEALLAAGYKPYYLYKQSRSAANMENTGWAKDDTQCFYNIYTMDESQTVIACGAGAVSKIKDPYTSRLERIFNFKHSYEYISRFDEILSRKKEVIKYYEQFRKRIY